MRLALAAVQARPKANAAAWTTTLSDDYIATVLKHLAVMGCIMGIDKSTFWVEKGARKHRENMSFFFAQSSF